MRCSETRKHSPDDRRAQLRMPWSRVINAAQCSDALQRTHLDAMRRDVKVHSPNDRHVQLAQCNARMPIARTFDAMFGDRRRSPREVWSLTRCSETTYNCCNANARMRYNARTFDALRCNAMLGCATMLRDTKALAGCPPHTRVGSIILDLDLSR